MAYREAVMSLVKETQRSKAQLRRAKLLTWIADRVGVLQLTGRWHNRGYYREGCQANRAHRRYAHPKVSQWEGR